ncbi:zf-TFIIB domain-containing protein [Polymorphospora sp. NPDC050346]|uniref:TFIIB-type zinc ribbon-containing protein n=1 Tax=Polymorphospora sp. NPDC050346 TaxID=3155780 RepID=UPI003409EC9F
MQMTCPKCRGDMRQYERSGVTIDQCGECRGIFLDRGELERLFEAEANWNRQHPPTPPGQPPAYAPPPPGAPPGYAPPPPPGAPPGYAPPPPPGGGYQPPPPPGYRQAAHVPPPPPAGHGYPPPHGGGHYGYHGHYRQKRQKSFLNELFD